SIFTKQGDAVFIKALTSYQAATIGCFMGSGHASASGDASAAAGAAATTSAGSADCNGEVNFNHFNILRAIGRGAFGKVCIVQKKDTEKMYAMKYMSKQICIEKGAVKNVIKEIQILADLDFPFLVNMWYTFQDQEDMFVVVDLLLGGDLRYHIQHNVRFSEASLRLYLAQMGLALDYLYTKHILHRDIKPDNLIFDEAGNVFLTDFNVAAVLLDNKMATEVSGTKPYMAPEVFQTGLKEIPGYSYAADWWSLGVTIFELARCRRPFDIGSHLSLADCLSAIRSGNVHYPSAASPELRSVLMSLLEQDPGLRLSSLQMLRSHSFMRGLDWPGVLAKTVKPVFAPPKHQLNCDPTYELEEMIIESKPLHKKKKRLAKLADKCAVEDTPMSKALNELNTRFLTFNRDRVASAAPAELGNASGAIGSNSQNLNASTERQKSLSSSKIASQAAGESNSRPSVIAGRSGARSCSSPTPVQIK
ncbi:hypothetical protein BOX15_Mlig002698g1, partial [Macrostomum lignano]